MENKKLSRRWVLPVALAGVAAILLLAGWCLSSFDSGESTSATGQGVEVRRALDAYKTSPQVATTPARLEDPRAATVSIEGEEKWVLPNIRNEFPRLVVRPQAVVRISLPFPELPPGAKVAIDAEDGGTVMDARGGYLPLNDESRADFSYQLPAHEGAHRVSVRHGSDTRTFEYWVGEEPPLVVRR